MFDNSCYKVITIAIIIMLGQASVLYSALRYVRSAVVNVRSAVVNVRSAVRNIKQKPVLT